MRSVSVLLVAVLWPGLIRGATVSPQDLVVFAWEGDTFSVPIMVSGGEWFKGASVNVFIDERQAFEIIGIERKADTIMQGSSHDPAIDPYYPFAVISDFSMGPDDPPVAANGILAVVHLRVLSSDPGTYWVRLWDWILPPTQLFDADSSPLPTELRDGMIILNPPEPAAFMLFAAGALMCARPRPRRFQSRPYRAGTQQHALCA